MHGRLLNLFTSAMKPSEQYTRIIPIIIHAVKRFFKGKSAIDRIRRHRGGMVFPEKKLDRGQKACYNSYVHH